MAGSQLYIGARNGVVICVDSVGEFGLTGRLFHRYCGEAIPFAGTGEMVHRMESFFDEIGFPRAANNIRSFTDAEPERRNYMDHSKDQEHMQDAELLKQHGYQGTFIVRVQHRQNSTWQGRITWSDKDQTLNFRSIWEMIHLMESALDLDSPKIPPDSETWSASDADPAEAPASKADPEKGPDADNTEEKH